MRSMTDSDFEDILRNYVAWLQAVEYYTGKRQGMN